MYIIGLTGGIAAGKSLVAKFLKENYDCVIIDADQLARKAVDSKSEGLKKVIQAFGNDILRKDGNLDRKKLGQIIAHDAFAKKRLEAIVHPQVAISYQKQIEIERKRETKVIIYDCPLLFEANLQETVDEIFLVVADKDRRARRIMERNGISADLADKKINMQMSDDDKEIQADLIIDNNGTISDLLTTLDCYFKSHPLFT